MRFEILILGANSALPSSGRFPSSQVIFYDEQIFLVDCGEGSQIKMSEYKVKRSKINQIFISHLHGDHIYGLPGLISSYNLMGRQEPLSIYAPHGLEEIIKTIIFHSSQILSFPILFKHIDTSVYQSIFENEKLKVFTIPMVHRIPTCGFLFLEKPSSLNILEKAIQDYDLDYEQIRAIKNGADLVLSYDTVIKNEKLTSPPKEARKYAYCSDTKYDSSYFKYIAEVDLLYHEATYTHNFQKKAVDRFHSTAHEAALVAKKVGAKKLLIGHYSSRYKELSPLLEEAMKIFPQTEMAIEGKVFSL